MDLRRSGKRSRTEVERQGDEGTSTAAAMLWTEWVLSVELERHNNWEWNRSRVFFVWRENQRHIYRVKTTLFLSSFSLIFFFRQNVCVLRLAYVYYYYLGLIIFNPNRSNYIHPEPFVLTRLTRPHRFTLDRFVQFGSVISILSSPMTCQVEWVFLILYHLF